MLLASGRVETAYVTRSNLRAILSQTAGASRTEKSRISWTATEAVDLAYDSSNEAYLPFGGKWLRTLFEGMKNVLCDIT
jgi:hypothetical protein